LLSVSVRAAHPQTVFPFKPLFFAHDVVIFAQVTALLPKLPHFRILPFRHSPDIFAKSLMPFSVLLYALLNLFPIKPLRCRHFASLRDGLRRGHIAQVTVTRHWRRHANVMGWLAFLEAFLNR
jgi:hypothetical protein